MAQETALSIVEADGLRIRFSDGTGAELWPFRHGLWRARDGQRYMMNLQRAGYDRPYLKQRLLVEHFGLDPVH